MAGMHIVVIQVKVFGGAIMSAEQQHAGKSKAPLHFHHSLICQLITFTIMQFISI